MTRSPRRPGTRTRRFTDLLWWVCYYLACFPAALWLILGMS